MEGIGTGINLGGSGPKKSMDGGSTVGTGVDSTGILGGITDAVGTIGNIVIGALNYEQAQKNYEQQKKQFSYSKKLQEKIFEREDNSVLRRVADLQRAGLNKVLAAGQGAGSGAVVSTTAPQKAMMEPLPKLNSIQTALSIMQQKADISKTVAQKYLTDKEIEYTETKKRRAEHDYSIELESGQPSSSGWFGGIIKSLVGASSSQIIDALRNAIEQKYGGKWGRNWKEYPTTQKGIPLDVWKQEMERRAREAKNKGGK